MLGLTTWDRDKLERLKTEYNKHKHDPEAVFVFEEQEFLVGFAGYMIQYLESQLPPLDPRRN